jgi:hypothetical protein
VTSSGVRCSTVKLLRHFHPKTPDIFAAVGGAILYKDGILKNRTSGQGTSR